MDFLSRWGPSLLTYSSDSGIILLAHIKMQILIVEDDRKLARQLKKGLDEHGHFIVIRQQGRDFIP